jgi:hypothetical protein
LPTGVIAGIIPGKRRGQSDSTQGCVIDIDGGAKRLL